MIKRVETGIFFHFIAAFWAVFTFGSSGPAITAYGFLDL
jgi:hypothetical protein